MFLWWKILAEWVVLDLVTAFMSSCKSSFTTNAFWVPVHATVTLNCYGNPILQDKKKKVVAIVVKVLLFYESETKGLFVAKLHIHCSILIVLDLSVAFDPVDHFLFLENPFLAAQSVA